MRFLKSNWFILSSFLLLGGLMSAVLRYEVLWDLANYHYFNPWAFLNNRVGYDIGVAGVSFAFNPLMDIPLYGLIQVFNDYPTLISFLQGLWFGGLLFVFFKILTLFFDSTTLQGKLSIVLSLLIAGSGWSTFMQIGTSSNEIPMALLVLSGVYFLLREIFIRKTGHWYIFLGSGFLLGSALGLKLTSVISCVALGLTLLIFYSHIINFKKNIPLFILGGLLGFLVFNGFWMYILWEKYQNPIFPFLNSIFKSEYLPFNNHFDAAFIPQTWQAFLFYPFQIFDYTLQERQAEALSIDYRLAILFFLFILTIILFLKNKICRQVAKFDGKYVFLFTYLLIFYLIWISFFAIKRYFVVFEMLGAIFIVMNLVRFFPKREWMQNIYFALGIILFYMLLSTPYYSEHWGKLGLHTNPFVEKDSILNSQKYNPDYSKYVNIKFPGNFTLPQEVLVMFYHYPSSIILPILNERVKARGVIMWQRSIAANYEDGREYDLYKNPKWKAEIDTILTENTVPRIAIVAKDLVTNIDFSNDPILKEMTCRNMPNNILPWKICVQPELEYMIFGNKEKNR